MQNATKNMNTTSRVMYTPHTSRVQGRQRFDLSSSLQESEEIDGLQSLIQLTWRIHAVSTLFDIQTDDINLKLYSKKLREEIANILSKENVSYDAKFSIMEDMSRPNQENYLSIKIEVFSTINNREEDETKCIYKGILLSSWKTTETRQNIENSMQLPLLLCRGTHSCMDAVHNILTRMFDCLVIALSLEEDDLHWLVPIIIISTDEERERGKKSATYDEIQMEYTVPRLPASDNIVVKFKISDLKNIIKAIVKNTNDDDNDDIALNLEHIELFYEVLHTQMLQVGGLKLGMCTLHKINLPTITIMENRMKVMRTSIMNYILVYLSEKALDTFHTIHIDT